MKKKVFLLQKIIPNYREPVFKRLNAIEGLETTIFYFELDKQAHKESFSQKPSFQFSTINLSQISSYTPFFKYIRNNKPDLIIVGAEGMNLFEHLLVYFYTRINKIPFIEWFGGTPYVNDKENSANYYKSKFRFLRYHTPKKILRRSKDGFVVYNEYTKHFLRHVLKINKNIFIAPNSVDTELLNSITESPNFINNINQLKHKYCPNNEKVILTLARLTAPKHIEWLIEAFRKTENNTTVLIIIGNGESLNKLKSIIFKDKIKNVYFIGAIYNEEILARYFSLCDIFILTEASIAIKYAMFYRKTVITMDYGNEIHDIQHNNTGLIVKYGDIEELTYNLNNVLKSDRLRKHIGNNAHKYIIDKCNINRMVKGFKELINYFINNT